MQSNKGLITNFEQNKMNNKPKAFIFDIDGTLSDHSHRINHAHNKDWEKYNSLHILDNPIVDVCRLVDNLRKEYHIIFLTGRPAKYLEPTVSWLDLNVFGGRKLPCHLIMRQEGNFKKSSEFKKDEYLKIKKHYDIIGAFDDNEEVVQMFRQQGVTCFALPDYKLNTHGLLAYI